MIDLNIKFKHKSIFFLLIIFILPPIGFLVYKYNYSIHEVKTKKEVNILPKIKIIPFVQPYSIFKISGNARDIQLNKDASIAFIASSHAGINIISLKDHINPSILSVFKFNKSTGAVTLSNDEKILYAIDEDGVFSIDITNPKNPKLLASIKLNSFHGGQVSSISISEDGEKLYIAGMHGLYIADITQKRDIKIIGKFYDGIYNDVVEVNKNTIYLLDKNGIDILDISDISKPKVIGGYATLGTAHKITLSKNKNRAYISSYSSGVEIVNMKNKLAPEPFGSFTTSGQVNNVTSSDNEKLLYVSNLNNNLEIYDVSYTYDPKLIQTIKSYDEDLKPYDSALSPDGKNLYIASIKLGLGVVKLPKLK